MSYQVDVTVDRDAGSTDNGSRFYYALDWLMNVPSAPNGYIYGYMGLQNRDVKPDSTYGRVAIVSLFTAPQGVTWTRGRGTDGVPADCHSGATEGDFVTCRIAYEWQAAHTYRYLFQQSAADRWTASITDLSVPGTPVSTLGTFAVPSAWDGIRPVGGGWIEQYVTPPETQGGTPVCPSRWTVARFENSRLNGTLSPLNESGRISSVNNWPGVVVCQNAVSTGIPGGFRLEVDEPTPAPVADGAVTRYGTSATVSWRPARSPADISADEMNQAAVDPDKFAALAASPARSQRATR